MDPLQLLHEDHENVLALFRQFDASDRMPIETREALAAQIFNELRVHETIEEEIFYPALKQRADEERRHLVVEAFAEHHVADLIIKELESMDVGDEEYSAKMKVLQETVEHHIEEEETDLFVEARDLLGPKLMEMGDRLEKRKMELLRQPKVEPPSARRM